MNVGKSTEITPKPPALDRLGTKICLSAVSIIICVAALFCVAGRGDWLAGWAYVGLLTFGQSTSALFTWRKNPELLRRRATIGKGTKRWDKICLGLFGLTYLAAVLAGAVDAGRYGPSTMPGWLWVPGAALYVAFLLLLTWSMAVNPYFEKTVRIQEDRGHRVIDSGPYRIVRHPGYVATILGFILSTPLLLGSWWALVPALMAVACLVVRTFLEDRTLRKELPGYEDYARRVRWRLMPGVW